MADEYLRKVNDQVNYLNSFMKNQIFKDELFPHNINSIGKLNKEEDENNLNPMNNLAPAIKKRILMESKNNRNENTYNVDITHPDFINKIEWKRINEIHTNVNLLNNNPNIPDDLINNVIQGHLGNCYYLSAIASCAEFKNILKYIFQKHYDSKSKDFLFNRNGLINLKVFINGKEVDMILDDYFPFVELSSYDINNDNFWTLALSIFDAKSKNIWPLLLEKAWAKANGNYGNIIKGNIPQAFYFISPSPVDIHKNSDFYPNNTDEIYSIIKKADKRGYIICSDISNDISNELKILTAHMGLLRNHAYSILSVWELVMRDGDIVKLLKIRNPWGNLEWNGDWSDQSNLWTDEHKKQVGYSNTDDGSFFIDFLDFLKFFTTTYICNHHTQKFKYTFKKFPNKEKDSLFSFRLEILTNSSFDLDGYLIVNLKSTKIRRNLTKNPNFENCNISLFLFEEISSSGKGNNNNINFDYNYIDSIVSNNDRISLDLKNEVRRYVVLLKINHDDFPKKILYESANDFIKEKLEEISSFKIGLYSNLEEREYKLERIDLKEDLLKNIFTKSFQKKIDNYPEGVISNFYEENEKETFRVLNFDNQKTAMGLFVYNNYSNADIYEKIEFNNLSNVSLVPILLQNFDTLNFNDKVKIDIKKTSNELDIEENIFDDDNENEFLNCFKDAENNDMINLYGDDNKNDILNINSHIFTKLDKEGKKYLLKIPSKSRYYGLLIKNSEDTDFEISSNISFKYLLSAIWQEKQFETKKTKLKYKDTSIPIFETFIKYNNGLFIKYKNKTNEFIAEMKIKLHNVKNTKINDNNMHIFKKIYGEEEAESIIKIDDDNTCMIIVHPSEIAFLEITCIDPFEDMNYDVNINYNIYTV
jgi:hypothetical protein